MASAKRSGIVAIPITAHVRSTTMLTGADSILRSGLFRTLPSVCPFLQTSLRLCFGHAFSFALQQLLSVKLQNEL